MLRSIPSFKHKFNESFSIFTHHDGRVLDAVGQHPGDVKYPTLSTEFIAELLRVQGARAEPHTLENLVTHRSQKFWLSRDCPYVRTPSPMRVAPLP